jgi:hypothetical protein
MSHENSRTIFKNGVYLNVNGRTGRRLKPIFQFEESEYRSLAKAVRAARLRSKEIGSVRRKTDANSRR